MATMRSSALALVALVAAASVGACAGSPVEAESVGGTTEGGGDTTAASSASSTASASTTSPSGSAGDPTGASASETTADPSGDPTGDPSGDPTGSTTDDATSASSASSSDASSSTQAGETSSDGGESSDTRDSGDVGGCLGDPLPEVEPLECSMTSETDATLEIENTCAFSIEVFWVNYECDEESYQVISSENSWSVPSFETHPWRIRSVETGDLILEIPPLLGDTDIIVQ
jgi:hypothetical protein